jgi:NMD protein affecting ribosome stability and mRNA decay
MNFCLDCGKRLIGNKNKRCIRCYKKFHKTLVGKNSPYWVGDYPKCKECGKELHDRRSEYCPDCKQIGNRNPIWKNGISLKKYYCKKCGKKLSNYSVALNSGLCFGCVGS